MAIPPKPISKALLIHYTTINFDDVPDGAAVDTHYATKGVKFASITTNPSKQWRAFARTTGDAETKKNVVSVKQTGDPSFDAYVGGIEATFTTLQQYVSIDARPVIDTGAENDTSHLGRPWIQSFDQHGNLLDTDYYPIVFGQPGWGDYRPLSLYSAPPMIAKVRFSCHPSAPKNAPVYGLFDRLVFTDQISRTVAILLGAGG
jgi:hypothetical protein